MVIAASSSAQPGVLIHLGKAYAVGLLWFTVQEDNQKNLLQQRLQKTAADYHCLRVHIAQQQGFGWLNKGHRRGMPVAAAIVADQLVGEWHGVFEADNGWWYLQVRSDTITPQGDRFFTSEEEAFHVFQQEMQNHNWPYAYAPAKWNLNAANIRTLELKALLDGLATTVLVADNLSAIFGGTLQRNLVLGGLISAFVMMGGLAAYSVLKPPEEIVLPPPRPLAQLVKPIPALEPPKADLVETVSVPQFFAACGQALSQLYQPIPGWEFSKFTCKNDVASLAWQQKDGSITQARTVGAQYWPSDAAINYTNRIMTVTLKLTQLPKTEQSEFLAQENALLFLEQAIQPLGAVQVKPVIPAPLPAPKRPAGEAALLPPPAPVLPLPYLDVALSTGFAPDKLPALNGVNGIAIKAIEWDIAKATWSYQFSLYHTRVVAASPAPAKPADVKQIPPTAAITGGQQ